MFCLDRSLHFTEKSIRMQFARLMIEIEDDLRLRLSQLLHVSDEENNMKCWPFCPKYFAIVNTINYLIVVFEEWSLFPV